MSTFAPFERFVAAAYCAGTRSIYKRDVQQFVKWGGSIPATPESIATYLSEHARSFVHATLSRKLAALHKEHLTLNYESPVRTELVRATLRGIARTYLRKQRQVKPLLTQHVEAILEHMQGLRGTRDKALLLLGFLGGFRRSEIVSLEVEDMSINTAGIVVHLKRSKTDQEGEGRDVAIPKLAGGLCAVVAIREWLDAAAINRGPLFRQVNRHGDIGTSRLTSGVVAALVKEYVKKIGLDPREYSGHSLRAGLVTSAAIAGAADWQIRRQTGHKSIEMVNRYIRQSEMFSDNVAEMIVKPSNRKAYDPR